MNIESASVFTDGSSRGNPGPGGFGAVIVYTLKVESGEVKELGGREEYTTNNRMELRAAIESLSSLSNVNCQMSIVIYTDSSYLINGITKWVFGWKKNGWKTVTKKEVENQDLWEKLIEVARGKQIEWRQVGGHVGVAGNVRCDEIATAFADGLTPKLYSGVLKNYSIRNILELEEDAHLAAHKDASRSRSGGKAHSYVSLVNGVVQTHKSWAECEARVKGKKAKYKKALSAEEERALTAEWSTR